MSNIIQLLPDSIANQIAAGEVIQRPASVVKELLENAIDAQSKKVQIIVRDSGKTLIQVIDDGIGMSDTDARMSFERHATSKITSADDIYTLKTMGFRGEALASIASVAMVDLVTRQSEDELATEIRMRGSTLEKQTYTSAPSGTNIAVKQLFFNTPARRKFLKSDPVEFRHILEEVQRVVLAYPNIQFVLFHNDKEILHLPVASLRQRVAHLFGRNSNEKLVPIEEETEAVRISGFISKPEAARKTRGQQYFFVNHRYFKSGYLHHAVMKGFEQLIPPEHYPSYAIYLEMDPGSVDVNIHPTKQEVKFENDRLLYQYLSVSIRHALGKFAAVPSLDFEGTPSFITQSGSYTERKQSAAHSGFKSHRPNPNEWEQMFEQKQAHPGQAEGQRQVVIPSGWDREDIEEAKVEGTSPIQVHRTYILSQIKSGFILLHQHHAHFRILFDRLVAARGDNHTQTQRLLFPETIQLSAIERGQFEAILPKMNDMGFEIEPFGGETFIAHGVPVILPSDRSVSTVVEGLLEQVGKDIPNEENLLDLIDMQVAKTAATPAGRHLTVEEMQQLIDALFRCGDPYKTPEGKPCFIQYDLSALARQFKL